MSKYIPCSSSAENPVYKVLEPSHEEIRVLRLEPGDTVSELKGSLSTTSFTSIGGRLEYDAISYCWGEASQTGTLELGTLTLEIPTSAEEALRALRAQKDVRNFWIDAICINQVDKSERAQQVALMADVYRGAKCTHIWLGKEDDRTNDEIACLKTFEAALPHQIRAYPQPLGLEQRNAQIEGMKTMPLPRNLNPEPLRTLLGCNYFRRMWVFQEIVLSDSSICHIGSSRSNEFPWTQLEIVVEMIMLRFWDLEGAEHRISETWGVDLSLPRVTRSRKILQSEEIHRIMSQLVVEGRNLLATDPRDNIYGLLGLYSWNSANQTLPNALKPNYETSIKACFRDATRELIKERKGLHHLILCLEAELLRTTKEEETLPSWVPNYVLTDNERLMTPLPLGHTPHNIYNVKLREHNDLDTDSLVMTGYTISFIKQVFPPFQTEFKNPLIQAQEDLQDLTRTLEGRISLEDRVGGLVSILLAGSFRDELLVQGIVRFHMVRRLGARILLGDAHEYFTTHPPWPHWLADLIRMEKEMKRICGGRRLFTIDGHMGIGPAAMHDTDLIVVLTGCPWLIALRPVKKWYSLVGPCYVYGLMDGAFIKQRVENGVPLKDFDIR